MSLGEGKNTYQAAIPNIAEGSSSRERLQKEAVKIRNTWRQTSNDELKGIIDEVLPKDVWEQVEKYEN